MAIDTSLEHAMDAVNGLSKDNLQCLVSYVNEIYDLETVTTIEKLLTRVKELESDLESSEQYIETKLLPEIDRLKAKLREGEDE